MTGGSFSVKYLAVLLAFAAAGLAAAGYVLVQQGAPIPLDHTYAVGIELERASGVQAGVGQPVLVSGVRVGAVSGVERRNGRALVTLSIEKAQLPVVYRDARATLTPISPLNDMQVVLDPGSPRRPALGDGDVIPIAATESPLPPSAILASLDTDTRQFLTSLLASLEEGTKGNGTALQRAIATLGPVASQTHELSTVLAQRRRALSRLVTNLGVVSASAADDGRLAAVVRRGSATVGALASRETQLRQTIAGLPGTLAHVRRSLLRTSSFSAELTPTINELLPVVRRIPGALEQTSSLARTALPVLRRDVRPLVREVQPLLRTARPAVTALGRLSPQLTTIARGLNYLLNVAAYNPEGRTDEGGLFWLAWFSHNLASLTSVADAHGAIGRASLFASCTQLTGLADLSPVIATLFGVQQGCP